MATAKNSDKTTTEAKKQEPEEFYHIRLKGASMFNDPASGLELNALNGNSTGMVSTNTPKSKLKRVELAIQLGRLEVFDPTLPDMTEVGPAPKKDLTRTTEARVISRPDEPEILRFIEMVREKGPKGVVSLKIMHHLETTGENPGLKPRGDIVDAIEQALTELGIEDPKLTEIETDRIMVLSEKPQEVLISMQ
jgi:hypothetical protein